MHTGCVAFGRTAWRCGYSFTPWREDLRYCRAGVAKPSKSSSNKSGLDGPEQERGAICGNSATPPHAATRQNSGPKSIRQVKLIPASNLMVVRGDVLGGSDIRNATPGGAVFKSPIS